jgi:hypothetical protein
LSFGKSGANMFLKVKFSLCLPFVVCGKGHACAVADKRVLLIKDVEVLDSSTYYDFIVVLIALRKRM